MYSAGGDCKVNADGSRVSGNDPIQNIPRNWKDAYGVRVGASYWVIPELEVLVGAGYDSNAIASMNMDPALMDFDKFTFALGGGFKCASGTRMRGWGSRRWCICRGTRRRE